jgi:hypothetical protein
LGISARNRAAIAIMRYFPADRARFIVAARHHGPSLNRSMPGAAGFLESMAPRPHIRRMSLSDLIIFQPQRIADDDWQVRAFCPRATIEYITGFKSEEAAKAWIAGSESFAWRDAWSARNVSVVPR